MRATSGATGASGEPAGAAQQMGGVPEGTAPMPAGRRRGKVVGYLAAAVLFVVYLLFRLVQAGFWLAHHV